MQLHHNPDVSVSAAAHCESGSYLLIQRLQRRVHTRERQVLSHHLHQRKRRQLAAAYDTLKLSQHVLFVRLNIKSERGGTKVDGNFFVLRVQPDGGVER
jgi:hypothetical protein